MVISTLEFYLLHGDTFAPTTKGLQAYLFRNMVKETARQLGYHVTFMAKPFADIAESSFHLHVSLWKEGKNVFAFSEPNPTVLPKELLHFIGGCQKYLNRTATLAGWKSARPVPMRIRISSSRQRSPSVI